MAVAVCAVSELPVGAHKEFDVNGETAQFDVRTGEVACWANFPPGVQLLNVVRGEKALKTFATKVVDGKVYVEAG